MFLHTRTHIVKQPPFCLLLFLSSIFLEQSVKLACVCERRRGRGKNNALALIERGQKKGWLVGWLVG